MLDSTKSFLAEPKPGWYHTGLKLLSSDIACTRGSSGYKQKEKLSRATHLLKKQQIFPDSSLSFSLQECRKIRLDDATNGTGGRGSANTGW